MMDELSNEIRDPADLIRYADFLESQISPHGAMIALASAKHHRCQMMSTPTGVSTNRKKTPRVRAVTLYLRSYNPQTRLEGAMSNPANASGSDIVQSLCKEQKSGTRRSNPRASDQSERLTQRATISLSVVTSEIPKRLGERARNVFQGGRNGQ